MKPVPVLASVIDLAADQERSFLTLLTSEERMEEGSFQHWSARDTLAHIAYWRQQMADKLHALANPAVDTWKLGDDEQNAIVYKAYHHLSWEEVERLLAESHLNVKNALEQADPNDLQDPALDPQHHGRQPWKSVISNSFTHPIVHLAAYLVDHGRKEQALKMQEDATRTLLTLDDDPEWQGIAVYNLACVQALLGDRDQALANLREALNLAPTLVPWSKEDPDLASLRPDPRFQALDEEVG